MLVYELVDLLFALGQMLSDVLRQSLYIVLDLHLHYAIKYVFLCIFLELDDVGVAFLFGFLESIVEVDVSWLLLAFEMLLGMLDDAGGTQRHEALF